MGLLSRLFAADPQKDLAKAKNLLDSDPQRAFELTEDLLGRVDATLRSEAIALHEQARQRHIDDLVGKADASEKEEYFADAAEWLDSAIAATSDVQHKTALEGRRDELLRQEEMLEEGAELDAAGLEVQVRQVVEATVMSPEIDPDEHFDLLVDMLSDEVGAAYQRQDAAFRDVFLSIQNGDIESMDEKLSALLPSKDLKDPSRMETSAIVALERGRLRLLNDNFQGAREDFDDCWEFWGNGPLDRAGNLSVPGLWAQALIGLNQLPELLETLAEAAQPRNCHLDIMLPYAQALVASESHDEAIVYLRDAMANFPSQHEFPPLYALTLVALGDPKEAIACLEMAITPACSTGNCSRPGMPMNSLRLLISLHLTQEDSEGHPERRRIRKLLEILAESTRGALTPDDLRLQGAYLLRIGQDQKAEAVLERAQALEAAALADGRPTLELGGGAIAPAPSDRMII